MNSDDDQDHQDEMKENVTKQQQNQAVADLSKIWEELQTVQKVIKKLNLERQHLETTLNHAQSVISNKKLSAIVFKSTSSFSSFSSSASEQIENMRDKEEIERHINGMLKRIEQQGKN